MDTDLRVTGSLQLTPVFWQNPPEVTVGCGITILYQGPLTDHTAFVFDQNLGRGQHQLYVQYHNKTNADCCIDKGLDQAVKIHSIEFFDIVDDRFLDLGHYTPDYPQPWANQQIQQGIVLPDQIFGCRYLGWNGTWKLPFGVPIFSWMHEILHLGYIYRVSG